MCSSIVFRGQDWFCISAPAAVLVPN